ncbi:hypothetical protein BKA62DRAFT_679124 [Auriculariales sp. MPI-PUGE-AT-0066]|nr:hypothetical protein BKA62DRAFT_679124 [Auriculariales sp. MPI-PUGE-AT-0066]
MVSPPHTAISVPFSPATSGTQHRHNATHSTDPRHRRAAPTWLHRSALVQYELRVRINAMATNTRDNCGVSSVELRHSNRTNIGPSPASQHANSFARLACAGQCSRQVGCSHLTAGSEPPPTCVQSNYAQRIVPPARRVARVSFHPDADERLDPPRTSDLLDIPRGLVTPARVLRPTSWVSAVEIQHSFLNIVRLLDGGQLQLSTDISTIATSPAMHPLGAGHPSLERTLLFTPPPTRRQRCTSVQYELRARVDIRATEARDNCGVSSVELRHSNRTEIGPSPASQHALQALI